MKSLFDTVDNLERAMTFHRDRHATLAGNLANLDTPGYQPVDLARTVATPESTTATPALAATDGRHLQAAGTSGPDHVESFTDSAGTASADGNGVNLEREMAKIAANRVRYATSTELATRRLALLRYGATDGNG